MSTLQQLSIKKNFRISNILDILVKEGVNYATPLNINYAWSFGAFAGIFLVIQILTGLFLAMHYISDFNLAFNSVEHIMREVPYGWLIRYMHANGASFFFIALYCHMARGLFYGSFLGGRYKIWVTGLVLFLLVMATAFLGYVLPFGQMSLWGATVITNLFSVIPIYGSDITVWIWGGFTVGGPTISRFYAIHYILPFIILILTILHIYLLHTEGSSTPQGDFLKKSIYVTFYPYFFIKDKFVFWLIMSIYSFIVFFEPNVLGHPDNYIAANPLNTPAHIVPEWYFLPFYAILRSIPNKAGGVVAMFGSIVLLFLLPIFQFNNSILTKTMNITQTTLYRVLVSIWCANFVLLSYLGGKPAETPYTEFSMISTLLYFFIWTVAFPTVILFEKQWRYSLSKYSKIYKTKYSKKH